MNRDNCDAHWMEVALELAKRGQGWVEPNPMVGCVVVRAGELIASGFHEHFGGPHAEVHALRGLGAEVLSESTVYVTLEPCAHHGKTPPCVELLCSKPPYRVVVAMEDPFEKVAGLGISRLRQQGIDVTIGVLEEQARALNAPYLKRLASGLPWVIAKWAMTLDGAIATGSGDSKWISNALSRQQVHRMRARVDAILVGSSTVLADDPWLTARLGPDERIARRALRVVLDRRFRIGLESRLVQSAKQIPVLVVVDSQSIRGLAGKRQAFQEAGVEFLELEQSLAIDSQAGLERILREIADRGGSNVLVEGGAEVFGSLFDARLVDQVECYIGPKLVGGRDARRAVFGLGVSEISRGFGFENASWESLEGDLHFSGILARCPSERP
ncbi:MAG: bifunctional diaminohydroxyphosphoribosylaminopyrimidine deaminase/5-amino-6-(5-phosphoribosylamino)uracil reductase RibD [Planctomycetota bacterium]|nr:bifunctional diaminohydroxyphosphoribosylaminopyrimidine deaminase/5-amino-6-(5-phosphoribosylamino)uracil reductase RibD [Planctomycetota bacterium]